MGIRVDGTLDFEPETNPPPWVTGDTTVKLWVYEDNTLRLRTPDVDDQVITEGVMNQAIDDARPPGLYWSTATGTPTLGSGGNVVVETWMRQPMAGDYVIREGDGEVFMVTPSGTSVTDQGFSTRAGKPYVTSLPSNPTDEQECYYLADSAYGSIWHLRYSSSFAGNHPWVYLGGADLFVAQGGGITGVVPSAANTITQIPGVTLTAPLAGIYDFDVKGVPYSSPTIEFSSFAAIDVTAGNTRMGNTYYGGLGSSLNYSPLTNRDRGTITGAGHVVGVAFTVPTAPQTTTWYGVQLRMTPIRVG